MQLLSCRERRQLNSNITKWAISFFITIIIFIPFLTWNNEGEHLIKQAPAQVYVNLGNSFSFSEAWIPDGSNMIVMSHHDDLMRACRDKDLLFLKSVRFSENSKKDLVACANGSSYYSSDLQNIMPTTKWSYGYSLASKEKSLIWQRSASVFYVFVVFVSVFSGIGVVVSFVCLAGLLLWKVLKRKWQAV